MSVTVETFTPANTPKPIGPYNHIAKVGNLICIGGVTGVNPTTGTLSGSYVESANKTNSGNHFNLCLNLWAQIWSI